MSREAAFTAELIRSSARGIAGQTVALFFTRAEDPETRYGHEGFESWRRTVAARFEALAGALDAAEPKMFADDLLWFRGLSGARGVPAEDLKLVVECMEATIAESLPGEAKTSTAPYFAQVGEALDATQRGSAGLAPGSAAEELFHLALVGDLPGTRDFLANSIRGGKFSMEEAIVKALLPAAREAGRRWHSGELSIATEHVVTATLRSALHNLATVLPAPPPNGKAAFLASVPGDAHDTGLVAFAILLEHDGWRVALAGADTPGDEIDVAAEAYDCDLIALSATLPAQRHGLISYLRDRELTIPVLVGGGAVRNEADALKIGAAGYAPTLAAGVTSARRLVELPER
jgi:methanogenic corrinoid protein MtbC1